MATPFVTAPSDSVWHGNKHAKAGPRPGAEQYRSMCSWRHYGIRSRSNLR